MPHTIFLILSLSKDLILSLSKDAPPLLPSHMLLPWGTGPRACACIGVSIEHGEVSRKSPRETGGQ